jgi:site-specific DNA recombinase
MSIRAAIYARYSSENQREASIADQVRLCEERIAREGWVRAKICQDAGISGATPLRPGYQALMAAARAGEFDVIVAEALDRLSRDQEDVAALFKRLRFAGITIVTLAEGPITSLHVGLKGAMNSIFLEDLANKTRRGLRGCIENRRSGGGNSFGYDVIPGDGHQGERKINAAQAAIVRRIFESYAAGNSPKRIALQLNKECVQAPRGGRWSSSTINGNRRRGTGIINNEAYAGRIVWNRLSYVKDPETGRRRSRLNPSQALVAVDVADWRVVPEELWQAVKVRQRALNGENQTAQPPPFWAKQQQRVVSLVVV